MTEMNRGANIERLKEEVFDVLVIGGGATGTGTAFDAATRGLKVALVEAGDFASGTSSRSTKLVHGGVRYLESAVAHLDRAQFHLVREALAERATLLKIAPHLTHKLRTVAPVYSLKDALFYRFGLWLYDRAAGHASLGRSHFVSHKAMLRSFPALRRKGLRGGVAYYDGQFDDARMNVTLAASAAEAGAALANYVCVTGLRDEGGRLSAATARDMIGGDEILIRARVIINATGPFADAVRRMESTAIEPLLEPSRGTHLAFDRYWAPGGDALLIPRTPDGRVLFFVPWEGAVIAGTTDVKASAGQVPAPSAEEETYLFNQLADWFDPAPQADDLRASWAGLRPLVVQADREGGTKNLVREHHIEVGAKGLVTIAGGKWTTYRLMAEEVVDRAVETGGLTAQPCRTRETPLLGATGYRSELANELAEKYELDTDIAAHLAHAYGDRAEAVLALAPGVPGERLAEGYPYVEAEVVWAAHHEMALGAEDVLARRLRLAFIDADAAEHARPRVEVLLRSIGRSEG
ncbi:MAG: glycerol-3-phosphate dehydrogenase/oxidase [Gammaproteobacteria bacterium]